MSSESFDAEGGDTPVVSIVLATLNERANITPLLAELFALDLPPLEVIVVDDGSVDGTREYVQAVMQRDRRVRLLCHQGRQTLTTAQLQGVQTALGRYIVIMDADLQHPPGAVPEIVRVLQRGATLVIASRYSPDGDVGDRPRYRALLSRGAELIARITLSGTRRVTDPLSGFFGFRRELARPLDPNTHGYKLLLFLLVLSGGKGVTEIGYRFRLRTAGSSKIAHGFSFLGTFMTEVLVAKRLEMWRASRRSRRGVFPTRDSDDGMISASFPSSDSQHADNVGLPPS